MESKENWWRKPAESAVGAEPAPQAGPEISGSFEDDLESDATSLGEVIDKALGDYDSRLAKLREQVEDRRAEVADLEQEIINLEKEQAKAFKDLLSSNKHIKRMLAPKPKRKTAPKRKKVSKTPDVHQPEDMDGEPLL
ncbi:MAG: hypothetical protein ACYSU7_17990 [Planctomycetota bacterium]|jgi:flagellar motility protein MotE (MotC chaperone)